MGAVDTTSCLTVMCGDPLKWPSFQDPVFVQEGQNTAGYFSIGRVELFSVKIQGSGYPLQLADVCTSIKVGIDISLTVFRKQLPNLTYPT